MKYLKNYYTQINIPENIKLLKKNKNLIIKNELKKNKINLHKLGCMGNISLNFDSKKIYLYSLDKTFFKIVKTLIQNKIYGLNNGFLVYLQLSGIGYKFELFNLKTKSNLLKQIIYFKIGFSHLYKYIVSLSVKVFLLSPTLICIYGIDKNMVYQVSSKIMKIKKPNSYKVKGIFFLNKKKNYFLKTKKK